MPTDRSRLMSDSTATTAASRRGERPETTEKRLLAELRAVRAQVQHTADTLRSLVRWQERRNGRYRRPS